MIQVQLCPGETFSFPQMLKTSSLRNRNFIFNLIFCSTRHIFTKIYRKKLNKKIKIYTIKYHSFYSFRIFFMMIISDSLISLKEKKTKQTNSLYLWRIIYENLNSAQMQFPI